MEYSINMRILASLMVVLNLSVSSPRISSIDSENALYPQKDISVKAEALGAETHMAYGGGMDLSYAADEASCSIPTINADNSKLQSFEKDTAENDTAELSKTEVPTITVDSSQGWYNANETTGACIKDSNGKVIEKLRSYQEIYGKDPPKPNYPPFLLEFLNKAACHGVVLVETDSWPGIKSKAGQTYVCYSYSAFVNATKMPYDNIENNKVVIDSSEITEFKPVPGTIYICV